MTYPFSIIIPALISLVGQIALWVGYFFYIPALNKTAVFWGGIASAIIAAIFLVFYRFLISVGQKAWNLTAFIAIFIQIATIFSGLWIVRACFMY
ncbi:MAG: hypothetical protein GX801_00345 [Fibrobacter sp.]|nr:hypothetical protein [Fibrobacter sp.]